MIRTQAIPRPQRHANAAILLFLAVLLSFHVETEAANSTITYTGASLPNATHQAMGVGLGHSYPGSNWLSWMGYMNPNSLRYFVNSITNWKKFIQARSPEPWGRSFAGTIRVVDQATFQAAAKEVRDATSSPGQPFVFDWIQQFPDVRWSQFVRTLSRPNATATLPPGMLCAGNPDQNLESLRAEGYHILALWHVTCKELTISNLERSSIDYWVQAWELYRWFYLGGRYLARNSVSDIELSNEPDNQICLNSATWLEEYRVRSLAFQNAYDDHATWSGSRVKLNLISPPMSAPKFDVGDGPTAYGRLAVLDIHTKFPSLIKDPNWYNSREFSYHNYNTPGYGFLSGYNKVFANVRALEPSFDIRISEHNIIAAATGERYPGRDVMNEASFAAGLAGQVASLAGRNIKYSSVNKFSQTFSASASSVVKNGLLFADNGSNRNSPGLCGYGGTSKTAEAYRLMLKRTPGGKRLLAYSTTPPPKGLSNFATFTIQDTLAYYIYMVNAGTQAEYLTFEMAKLPTLKLRTALPVVMNAVGPTHHGEVSAILRTTTTTSLVVQIPATTVIMAAVPKGSVAEAVLPCAADTFVAAGAKSGTVVGASAASLFVQTSTTSDQSITRAAIFKFSLGSISRYKIISAVLELTQSTTSSPGSPQILTVFGTDDLWDETRLTWDTAPGLSSLTTGTVASVSENFINYKSAKPVGMMTGGVSKQPVMSLDVGDYLRNGGKPSFLLTRMFRFDARGSGSARMPGDVLGGPVSINSREAATGKPVLRVFYQK